MHSFFDDPILPAIVFSIMRTSRYDAVWPAKAIAEKKWQRFSLPAIQDVADDMPHSHSSMSVHVLHLKCMQTAKSYSVHTKSMKSALYVNQVPP